MQVNEATRFYRDADGALVKKSDGAGTVMIVNAIPSAALRASFEHITATNESTSYYLFGGQRPSAGSGTVAMRVAGAVYWLHGDHLGSASLTTNASGQKLALSEAEGVAELRYLPFGETRWAWGKTPTDRRYTGQRELAGVGLYDYNARMYWPAACPERSRRAGRFVSADTVVPGPGDSQAFNRYMYVLGNSLRYSDPSGHHWFDALSYQREIIAAAEAAQIPALAVAVAVGSQTNGMWLDGITRIAGGLVGRGNPSLGPGQVRVTDAQHFGMALDADSISQPANSILIRAKIMATADKRFLDACKDCTAQQMIQDRWLVFALSQNDIAPGNMADFWQKASGTFNWDRYFEDTDRIESISELPGRVLEQDLTSRPRFLLRQFADYLERLTKYMTLNDSDLARTIYPYASNIEETVCFLRCMGAGGTTDGCR